MANTKRNNVFLRILSLVSASLFTLAAFSSCGEKQPQNEKKEFLDISGYMIVRRDASDKRVTNETILLKKTIESELGIALTVNVDWYNPSNAPDPNAKEILIDKTNRKESEEALAKLNGMPDDSYVIDVTENKIVIVGKSAVGTVRAIECFLNNYVLPSEEKGKISLSFGTTFKKEYDVVQNIYIEDKLDMDVEVVSTLLDATAPGVQTNVLGTLASVGNVLYPSIVELQYQKNEKDNGKLIATFEFNSSDNNKTSGSVWESTDGGESWKIIARPAETVDTSIKGIAMAQIYELPAKVGDMPAGTLIYAGNSLDSSRKSHVALWRSFDAGYTWEEYNIVASGGGLWKGVWEPFMWYEETDGYLYCFYSDDSGTLQDQTIVYKRSKDGVNWSETVDVCAFADFTDRPGMFAMTKMGNGEYFMVYEYCLSQSCDVYYKKTSDITSWNPSDPGTPLRLGEHNVGGSPWCVWTPVGGECGTLIATGTQEVNGDGTHRIFVSFDYGETLELMANPLPYDLSNPLQSDYRIGYSPSFFVGKDPSVIYYMNATDYRDKSGAGIPRMKFARLKLYE